PPGFVAEGHHQVPRPWPEQPRGRRPGEPGHGRRPPHGAGQEERRQAQGFAMTDRSEFEEKEYEGALYPELLSSPRMRPWTPGQVLEHQLGFDAALFVANTFWSAVGRPACEGVRLARYGLSPMVQRLAGTEDAPNDDLPD